MLAFTSQWLLFILASSFDKLDRCETHTVRGDAMAPRGKGRIPRHHARAINRPAIASSTDAIPLAAGLVYIEPWAAPFRITFILGQIGYYTA